MSTLTRLLALVLCTSTAQAATLTLTGYEVQPHRQRVLISTDLSLGYPVGDVSVGLALDCQSGQVQMVTLGRAMLGSNPDFADSGVKVADSALRQAVLASGLVSVKPGALTVKRPANGTIISRCQQKVLDTALLTSSVFGQTRTYKVPIYSQDVEPGGLFDNGLGYGADTVTLEVDVRPEKTGFVLRDLSIKHSTGIMLAARPGEQVVLSDGRFQYPVYYGGQSRTNASLAKFSVPGVLTVYMTLDGTRWTRTTLDFKGNRLKTIPAAKPTLPIRS